MLAVRFRFGGLVLDTVAIGCHVEGISWEALGDVSLGDARWNTKVTNTVKSGIEKTAYLNTDLVHLTYLDNWSWLGVEASLPNLVQGDNASLLDSAGCREGLTILWEQARKGVGRDLPRLERWQVSRFDPVWAWDHDPALYLGALVASHYPRTVTVCYPSSVRWVTPKGQKLRVRCYDKAQEAHHSVDLPLRFERQVGSADKDTVRVGGEVIGRSIDEVLNPKVSRRVLADALHKVGLDRPIRSILSARRALLAEHGNRAGARAWAQLVTLITCGGVWPSDVSPWSRRQYRRMWDQAGVSAVSPEGELPALEVPQTAE